MAYQRETFINQPSFAAGEVGPELYGRVDQELYYIALRTCRNFIVRQYGGVSNRAGSRFSAESKNSAYKTRLIPFQFNEVQTYCLQMGNQFMRVVKNGAEVLETAATKNITGITQANPGVVTSVAHGFSNGDDVYISGVVGMVELNGRSLRVAGATANTFTLTDYQGVAINTTGFAAYSSGGTAARIYTVSTPWTESALFDLNYAQSADVLTVVHPTYPIRDITRTAHDAWTVSEFNPSEGPFKDINITATTFSPSAISGTGITLTASAATFVAGDVGTLIYIEQMPTDTTKVWEVQKGILQSEIRRAGFNYYQAPTSGSVTKNITAITAASPGVVTSAAHGFVNGQVIYIDSVTGMTEVNKQFYKVASVTANTFTLTTLGGNQVSTAAYTAYVAGGTATTAWATGTVKPDHTEGSVADGDPGVPWTFLHAGFGIVKVTAFTSSTQVTCDVIKRLPDNLLTTASTNWAKAAWSSTQGYPAAVSYHKQRLWFGGSTLQPNYVWVSGIGARTFFGKSKPLLDDESITIALDTTMVNAVRHMLSLKQLVVLTSSSEQLLNGKDNSIDATAPPSPDVQGYNGSNRVHPIIIGNTALYVEDTGDVVRALQYDLQSDSFVGLDMTARSPHLFRNKQIVDWAYQKRPLAVIWAVMSDGALNGFTFMQEQKVYAWHRHDTDGLYESVCCIREGNETAAYKMVKRLVNGTYRRYLERDASRYFGQYIEDAYFVDSGLTYDGRNTTATTITITGGTTWDSPEVLTLTASSAIFLATDVNNQITFVNGNVTYRLTISAYTSGTVVSAIPTKALPVAYQGVARTDWRFARLKFRNLNHLEGKAVSVLADGNFIEGLSVSNGLVTLPRPGAVVHIGLPYTAELETLDMASPAGSMKAKSVNIPRLFLTVQESRAVYVAANAYGNLSQNVTANVKTLLDQDKFVEVKQRNPSIGYDAAIPAETGVFEVNTNSAWSNTGRICIRQPFPLPISINGITDEAPAGMS